MKTYKLAPQGPVLVLRTDAIGDLVLTLPAVAALKEAWPDLDIDIMVSSRAAPLLEGNPHLRRVVVDPGGLRSRVTLIREGGYRWAVVARPEPGIAAAVALAGVPNRVGTGRRAYSFLFNHRIPLRRKHGGRHEAEYNAELMTPLGVRASSPPWTEVTVTDDDRTRARDLLAAEGLTPGMSFVVVHPGSRGSGPNMPYGAYAGVVEALNERMQAVVLTGGRNEVAPLLELLKKQVPSSSGGTGESAPVVNLAGKTDLRGLIGVLAGARLVVASSTGPLHLAAAVGTPVLSAYGRRPAVSSTRWRPWVHPDQIRILTPEKKDCPARCNGRCGREGCLATLTPDMILEAAFPWLENAP